VLTVDERGAPPFWGWGVAAPERVRDGRAPANRNLGDSGSQIVKGCIVTHDETYGLRTHAASPTHQRRMDRFPSFGKPRRLVAPLGDVAVVFIGRHNGPTLRDVSSRHGPGNRS
jgi:hypothetical protein